MTAWRVVLVLVLVVVIRDSAELFSFAAPLPFLLEGEEEEGIRWMWDWLDPEREMKLPIAKLNCVGAEENFFFLLIHSRNLITAPLASDDDVELFSVLVLGYF